MLMKLLLPGSAQRSRNKMASRCAAVALCASSCCETAQLPGLSILHTDKPAELSVAVFPLACVFNVQHVSLQLFKHG